MENKRTILEERLNSKLSQGSLHNEKTCEEIIRESDTIEDYLVDSNDIRFTNKDNKIFISKGIDSDDLLCSNSVSQIASKMSIPEGYIKNLMSGRPWQQELTCEILNRHMRNSQRDNYLLRKSGDVVKGFLSKRFRRFKSSMLYGQFMSSVKEAGAQIISSCNSQTKIFMEAIHPYIVEIPVKDDMVYAVFGTRIQNSDYGNGILKLSTYMINCVCLNGLCVETAFKRVHLGGEINQDVELSQKTIQMDTLTHCSYIKDSIMASMDMKNLERISKRIQKLSGREIDITQETKKLNVLGITTEEIKQLESLFINSSGADGLSGDPTQWKFINGITALARNSGEERKRELEELSGKLFLNFSNN